MWIQKLRCGVQHIAYSLDGRFLYTLDTGKDFTVWDVASHSGHRIPPTQSRILHREVRGLHPLVDGRLLIRAIAIYWNDEDDENYVENVINEFILIDQSGTVSTSPGPPGLGDGFAQIDENGRAYYPGPTRETIVGCDLGGTPKQVFELPESPRFAVWQIQSFDWSCDGNALAMLFTGTHQVTLVESAADGGPHTLIPVTNDVFASCVQISPDGRTLLVRLRSPDRFTLWDVASRSVRVSNVECSMTWGVFAFNPVYPLFAMCQKDGTLAIWSLEDGRPVRSVDFALGRAVQCVAFSPDGLTCAVGGTNKQFAVFDVDV